MKLDRGWWGLIGGLVLTAMLAVPAVDALSRLDRARAERARLAAEVAAPAPRAGLVAPGLAMRAEHSAAARAGLLQRVRALAKESGLLVEEASDVAAPPPLAAIGFRVSGAEKAVIAFADTLERDTPLTRLSAWRLTPAAGGGLRLEAQAVAAWR